MIISEDHRDPSPLSSPADLLPISATADIGIGEEGFGSVPSSVVAEPGNMIEEKAQMPKPPSPLAGEGEGEGLRNSFRSKVQTFAKAMRKEPTDAERALWRIVRNKRLDGFKFKRQQPVGRYIADMVCLDKCLVIEADGGQHHENRRDDVRNEWLAGQGFRVLRFWNHEILREPQMVEDTILRELTSGEVQVEKAQCDPSPLPSPARGEGGTGSATMSAKAVPGAKTEDVAQMPKPPSPLAGEGEGEGLHKSMPLIALHKKATR